MGTIYSATFWKDAFERAVKSAGQAALLALGGGAVNLLELDVVTVAGAAGGGFVLSVLTSIGSGALPIGTKGTASLTKAVEPAE